MNNKVFDYLNEKKEDATRYAEERVNAVKEYIEKNGKQIKRSATALALAGLTTLSASTLSGCDGNINTTDPDSSYGTDQFGETYKIVDDFVVPTMRTEEDIKETGLKAEDVLALYDNLCTIYQGKILGPEITAHFKELSPYKDEKGRNCPCIGIDKEGFYTGDVAIAEGDFVYDTYYDMCLSFDYTDSTSHFLSTRNRNVGIHKALFEPLAESKGLSKYLCDYEDPAIFVDRWNEPHYYWDQNYDHAMVYDGFTITREDIEKANTEELNLIYQIGQSLWNGLFNQKWTAPNISESQELQP